MQKDIQSSKSLSTMPNSKVTNKVNIMPFINLCILQLLGYVTLFGMVTFFPQTCREKYINEGWMSTIMSVDPLLPVFLQPVISKYTYLFGRRNLVIFSQVLFVITSITMMILDFLNREWFIALGIISRLIQGVCLNIVETIAMSYVVNIYPQSYTIKIGILESMSSVGYFVGPPLFSLAYTLYGYWFPFAIMAFINFIFVIVTLFMLPKDKNYENEEEQALSTYFKDRQIIGYMVLIATLSFSTYYYEPFISLYLESIKITNLMVTSIYFQIPCIGYVIGSFLCSKVVKTAKLVVICHLMTVPILLVGGILWFDANIQLIIGLTLSGFCGGFFYILIFQGVNDYIKIIKPNIDEDIRTDISSGLTTTGFTIGAFLGPFGFGQITYRIQYYWANICMVVVVAVICILFTINQLTISSKHPLRQSLIQKLIDQNNDEHDYNDDIEDYQQTLTDQTNNA